MNDPEQLLRAARLAAPSAALDRRMAAAFAQSERATAPSPRPARPAFTTPWAWFGLYAAGAIAAAFVFVPSRSQPPRPAAPAICQIEPQGALRSLLLNPQSRSHPAPHFTISVSTE